MPCLDEAEALEWVLSRVPPEVNPIVVDNGSVDGSPGLARAFGAQIIECPTRGYGAACHAGLEAASAEVVAFCDCDASVDPCIVEAFAEPVIAGSADLVVARRRAITWSAWPAHARAANATLAWQVRRRTGVDIHDIGPLRAAGREQLLGLTQLDRRSGYPLETVILAARAGWRITQADVAYRPRLGRSKVTGTVRGTRQAVSDMRAVLARPASVGSAGREA